MRPPPTSIGSQTRQEYRAGKYEYYYFRLLCAIAKNKTNFAIATVLHLRLWILSQGTIIAPEKLAKNDRHMRS
jgi:hypothetical protein